MKRLVALQEIYYGSATRHPGDAFDASDQDATILIGIGKARAEDVQTIAPGAIVQKQNLQTTALKAEPHVVEAIAEAGGAGNDAQPPQAKPMTTPAAKPLTAPKKKTYKRRDMRAER